MTLLVKLRLAVGTAAAGIGPAAVAERVIAVDDAGHRADRGRGPGIYVCVNAVRVPRQDDRVPCRPP
jgi:hypothetical protein